MAEFLISPAERQLLAQLIGTVARQLVWDLNAIYIVTADGTIKIEVQDCRPDSPVPGPFDEMFGLAVFPEPSGPTFRSGGEDGMWYRVVAQESTITGIALARTVLLMPEERIVHPLRVDGEPGMPNLVDCGVLIETAAGVLPGVQRDNCFGFETWREVRLYTRDEVDRILGADYEMIPLHAASAT